MVWKPQMNCRWTLWRNKPHTKTQKSPNQLATTAKNQVIIAISAVDSNENKTKPERTRIVPPITTVKVAKTLAPTKKLLRIPMQTIQIFKRKEDLHLSTYLVRPVVKLTIPQRNLILEQTQRIDRLPGTNDQKDKIKSNREMPKATQMAIFKLQPKL